MYEINTKIQQQNDSRVQKNKKNEKKEKTQTIHINLISMKRKKD